MKYKLIKPVNPKYSALEPVLTNRGIELEDIPHYCNTTDEDINSPLLFGEDKLKNAATALISTIKSGSHAAIIVDSDCDGFTSSALLINYLYDLFPTWVESNLDWYIHDGKQHGLSDYCDILVDCHYSLVIVPDAGSNDEPYHKKLVEVGTKVLILDHHEADSVSPHAIIINNQLSDYPNKQLSGVGVTWQFCRYLDSLLNTNYANKYIDLVALGLTADMQSLLSFETKHLINKGFEPDNIHNPFIYNMWQKNQFKLGDHITSWGAAFYIAPFVNAMVRSGTQEEKELLFDSMLQFKAFEHILSNKRGHLLGETETLVSQAIRTCTNVKNRQTRAVSEAEALLNKKIEDEHLLNNKVLLLLLEPGQVDKNVAGLVANRFMAKYQRPCCILTKVEEEKVYVRDLYKSDVKIANYNCFTNSAEIKQGDYTQEVIVDKQVLYQGSARGCDKVGVTEFKDICAATGLTLFTAGHQGAFGLGIREQDIPAFIEKTNEILKDMSDEAIYYVDYIYDGNNVNPQNILDIAEMDSFWGKDIETSILAIKNLKVTSDMITIYRKTSNTIKITLPNKVSLMLFNATDLDCKKLQENNQGYVVIDCVGEANKNEWNGNITAQLFITDYEIIDSCKYFF